MGELQLNTALPMDSEHLAVPRPKAAFRDVVMGYNHQVPHHGRVFHIQTEDSGAAKRHIFTHVFYSGTIVASSRTDYGETTSAAEICTLLKKSQKSMLLRLVRGMLDEGIERCLGSAGSCARSPKATGTDRKPPLAVVPSCAADEHEPKDALESMDLATLDEALSGLERGIPGTLGVALVDYDSGTCVSTKGTEVDFTVAAAGNTKVMKAQVDVMRAMGMEHALEDMLFTLESQFHIIRPVNATLFLYVVIDREHGNLALARHKLCNAADELRA